MNNPNWKEDREGQICFKTKDNKYAVKSYQNNNKVIEYIVFEYNNPIENHENTYRGSLSACRTHLSNKGYHELIQVTQSG